MKDLQKSKVSLREVEVPQATATGFTSSPSLCTALLCFSTRPWSRKRPPSSNLGKVAWWKRRTRPITLRRHSGVMRSNQARNIELSANVAKLMEALSKRCVVVWQQKVVRPPFATKISLQQALVQAEAREKEARCCSLCFSKLTHLRCTHEALELLAEGKGPNSAVRCDGT